MKQLSLFQKCIHPDRWYFIINDCKMFGNQEQCGLRRKSVFCFYVCARVYVCACAKHACMCRFVHLCMTMCRPKADTGCLPLSHSNFLTELKLTVSAGLANQQDPAVYLYLPPPQFWGYEAHVAIFLWVSGFQLRPSHLHIKGSYPLSHHPALDYYSSHKTFSHSWVKTEAP